MDDRTFYCLSYTGFCLALLLPIAWFFYRTTRRQG